MIRKTWLVSTVVLIGALVSPPSPASAQQQTGEFAGIVLEADGSPAWGATVTLTGEHNIGGERAMWTNAKGEFRFLRLLPGEYTVVVEADGHNRSKRTLRVGLGDDTHVVVRLERLSPDAEEIEVIVIEGERLRVDPERTDTGTTFSHRLLQSLPTARDYLSGALLAPGVSGGANPNIHGGSPHSNQYLVDGVNTTDPTSNTPSMNFNYDAIEELEVLTGGFHPRYGNVSGGIINIVTKSGSNALQLDGGLYYQGGLLEVDAPDEELLPEDERREYSRTSVNLNVGGPIIDDHLWYFVSTEYNHFVNQEPSVSPVEALDGVKRPALVYRGLYWLLKLTGQFDRHNRVQLLAHADPTTIDNINQDPVAAPETETHQAQGGFTGKLEWDADYDPILLKVRAAYKRTSIDFRPQARIDESSPFTFPGILGFGGLTSENDYAVTPGCLAAIDRADGQTADDCTDDIQAARGFGEGLHVDLSDGSLFGGSSNDISILRKRTDLDAELTYLLEHSLGRHRIDVGLQVVFKSDTSTSRIPGGATVFYDEGREPDGTPIPDFATIVSSDDNELTQTTEGTVYAAYINDRWTFGDHFTLEPGVRLEQATHSDHRGDPVLQFFTVSPRLGFAIDPFGGGHTRVYGGYARIFETGYFGLSKFAGISLQKRLVYWNPETERYAEDPGEVRILGGEASTVIDDNGLEPLYTDEFRIAVEHAFDARLSAGIGYMRRDTRNAWEDREINLIWSVSGQEVVGSRAGDGQQVLELTTMEEARRVYDALEVHATLSGGPGWTLGGSYVLQWSEGTTDDLLSTGFDNPRQDSFLSGPLPDDLRHTLKLQAYHAWDFGLLLGAVFLYQSGRPYSAYFRDEEYGRFSLRRAPRGRHPGFDPNSPQDDRILRLADLTQLDLRGGWDLEDLIGHSVVATIDVFNVFNSTTTTDVYNLAHRDGNPSNPDFGLPLGIQRPLRVMLGLRYRL